ncbi:MAG: hypothetical protein JEZ05_04095 [Tenericutes bacterium]|nr:hypothetical protein [Mycoplasmatota bacterium]
MVFYIIGYIILIAIGLLCLLWPNVVLRLQDELEGKNRKREFSKAAILITRAGGLMILLTVVYLIIFIYPLIKQ